MRKALLLVAAVAFLGCNGQEAPAPGGGGDGEGQTADAQAQLDQARQEIQRLEGELDAARQEASQLESQVQTLEDSVESLRTLPSQLTSDPGQVGCVEWSENPDYLLCTHQSLSSR